MVDTRNPNNYTNIYQWKTNTTPYASKFTLCFIRFWMKLDKFTMVKVGNPLINRESCSKQVNSPIVNQIH
jgi:hypothetical protein